MAMTMQLDYFGGAGGALMLSLAPGDPATGQPGDHPERVPRTLG